MENLSSIIDLIIINVEYNLIFSLIIFFIFMLFYNSFSIPGNMFFIALSGFLFGIYAGYLISIISLVLGSLIFFYFSHFFIKKISPNLINRYALLLKKYISDSSIEYLIIFRMIPGPPLFIQNLLLSFLKISKLHFVISTAIGFTPYVFILVFIGSQFKDFEKFKSFDSENIFGLKFLIFVICIIFFILIRIRYKKK